MSIAACGSWLLIHALYSAVVYFPYDIKHISSDNSVLAKI